MTAATAKSIAVLFGFVLVTSSLGADEPPTFEDDVLPIFRNSCLVCHNTDKAKADLDLGVYSAMLARDVLAAGEPDESLLYRLITHAEEPKMPSRQPKLPDAQIETIRRWIEGGLLERSGARAIARKKPRAVVALADAPVGRPDGPPCMPEDLVLEPTVATAKPHTIQSLAFAPWAPLLAVGAPKQVLLYHGDGTGLLGVLPFPEGLPYHITFSRSGTLIVAAGGRGGHSGRAVVWDVANGRRICEAGDETDAVLAADISPDQTEIVIGGPAKLAKFFAVATGEPTDTIKKHSDWITALEYSPDGVLLASADRGGGLYLWESDSRQMFHDLRGHKSGITAIAWRDDGNLLASAGDDGEVILWNIDSGEPVKRWRAHGGGTTDVAFSHDGRLVTSGRDGVAKTWHGDGRGLRNFKGLTDEATACTFAEDGATIACGDWRGELRIYDAADGAERTAFTPTPPTLAARLQGAEAAVAAAGEVVAARNGALEAAGKAAAAAAQRLAVTSDALTAATKTLEQVQERHGTALKIRDGVVDNHKHTEELLALERASLAAAEKEESPDETAIAELRARVAEAASLLEEQRPTLEKAQRILAETQQELDAATATRDAEEKPFAAARTVATDADEKSKAAKQAADAAHAALRSAEAERQRWRAALINVERIAARDALEREEDLAFQREAELTDARGREETVRTQLAGLEAEVAAAPARIAEQQSVITRADAAIAEAKRLFDEKIALVATKAALCEAATAFLDQVSARAAAEPQNAILRDAEQAARASAEALDKDRSAATKAARRQESVISDHELTRDAAADDLAELRRELDALPEQVNAARDAVTAAAAVVAERADSLDEQRATIDAARRKLDELTAAYEAAKPSRNSPRDPRNRDHPP